MLITFHILPSYPLALWIHISPCIHEFDNDSHEHETSLFFAISHRCTEENEKISINWHKTPKSSSHSQIKYLLEPTLSLRKQSISITFIWVLLLLLPPRLLSYFSLYWRFRPAQRDRKFYINKTMNLFRISCSESEQTIQEFCNISYLLSIHLSIFLILFRSFHKRDWDFHVRVLSCEIPMLSLHVDSDLFASI